MLLAVVLNIILNVVLGVFVYKLFKRVYSLDAVLSSLIKKIKEGESSINTNFDVITKRFKRVENEIKDGRRVEVAAKEAVKAATRIQRSRDSSEA